MSEQENIMQQYIDAKNENEEAEAKKLKQTWIKVYARPRDIPLESIEKTYKPGINSMIAIQRKVPNPRLEDKFKMYYKATIIRNKEMEAEKIKRQNRLVEENLRKQKLMEIKNHPGIDVQRVLESEAKKSKQIPNVGYRNFLRKIEKKPSSSSSSLNKGGKRRTKKQKRRNKKKKSRKSKKRYRKKTKRTRKIRKRQKRKTKR